MKTRFASHTIGAGLLAAAVVSAPWPAVLADPRPQLAQPPAGQAGKSPLERVPPEQSSYLDGRLTRRAYKSFQGMRLRIVEDGAATQPAIEKGVTNWMQSALPAERLDVSPAMTARVNGKWLITYEYTYAGVPVRRTSNAVAILKEDGQVVALAEQNVPTRVDALQPTVARDAAVQLALQHFKELSKGVPAEASTPALEILARERDGRLTWAFTVRSSSLETPYAYRYSVAATGDAQILDAVNQIHHDHAGTVSGTVWLESPLGSTGARPLPSLLASRAGGGSDTTDAAGKYSIPGTGAATIQAGLSGDFSRVVNMAGAAMTRSQAGSDAAPIDLGFNASGELELAQVTAYYWTNIAHEYAKSIIATPGEKLPDLLTRVNINSTCNAFWDGSSINFFKAGGGCPNTAYSDVIVHEYGHGIDDRLGGIADGGYSEGFGDALAVLITRQPLLGRDFLGAGLPLRDAREVHTWPPPDPEVHEVGKIYAGFAWELTQQLKAGRTDDEAFDIAKRLILGAAAGNPADIPDAVRLSFIVDDDDGDLSTGTPHCKELKAAADSRKIPTPPELHCEPQAGCCPVVATAQFPFTAAKKVSANANILSVKIDLKKEMDVHLSANTSASTAGAGVKLRTGLYNQEPPNTMWTNSLRDISVPASAWATCSTNFAIRLKAGTHVIYWKIWISSGEATFSSGTLNVEAYDVPTTAVAPVLASAAAQTTSAASEMFRLQEDAEGNPIVVVETSGGAGSGN